MNRGMNRVFAVVVVGAGLGVAVSPSLAGDSGAIFIGLGTLDPDGFGPTIAYGISADGNVVVGETVSPTGFEAFRWTLEGGIVGLGTFPNPGGFPASLARGCSDDGSVIVGGSALPNSLNEDGSPFRWTQETGLVFLGSLGGTDGGVARGVSSDGSVVVGYGSNANFNPEAFRWTSNGLMPLGDIPGGVFNSQAAAVSGDGSIIVGLASKGGGAYDRSFKWTQRSGLVELAPSTFRAVGLSRDGHYAVGGNLGLAARLDLNTNTLFSIPHLPFGVNDTDLAWDASADGSVVVGWMNLKQFDGFFGRAFMWDAEHGTRIIRDVLIQDFGMAAQLAGWELNAATSVSDDGLSIAGYGFAPSGEQMSWFVRFPAPKNPCASLGDLNGDNLITGADLGLLLSAWNSADAAADLDGSGLVDGADLGLLLSSWGTCP